MPRILKELPRSKKEVQLFFVLSFLVGGLLGYALHTERVPNDATWGPIRTPAGEYRMIQPLLACDFPYDASNLRLKTLKSEIEKDIRSAQKNGSASNASVYVHMINSGGIVGVGENVPYDPASMVKVALMMTYARIEETHPELFSKQLIATESIIHSADSERYYGTTSLVQGTSYRVGDLIDMMIIDSDNGAKDLLLSNIPPEELINTMNDFGIKLPSGKTDDLKMSPKDISLFFRSLFSATYLNPINSEVSLELLARTTFKDGLVEGVPYGTQVAHKFGEFVLSQEGDRGDSLELHDCGIVYAPNNPYFLCVMTRGSSHAKLATLIATISRDSYNEITAAHP